MRVLVAGATGTLGKPATAALAQRGHDVVAMTRDAARAAPIRAHCKGVAVADALDERAVRAAMREHRPDAVVHLLTALPPGGGSKASDLAATNRLRTEGTRILLGAARDAGARRVVAESFFIAYGFGDLGDLGDLGDQERSEEDLPPVPGGGLGAGVAAARALEEQVAAFGREQGREGVALRLGALVGPGVPSFEHIVAALRAGKLPIIGSGRNHLPVVHIADAVSAIVAGLEGPSGVYNIADDAHPEAGALLRRWAAEHGAPPPKAVPYLLARLVQPLGAKLFTTNLKMSVQRARRDLRWAPAHALSP